MISASECRTLTESSSDLPRLRKIQACMATIEPSIIRTAKLGKSTLHVSIDEDIVEDVVYKLREAGFVVTSEGIDESLISDPVSTRRMLVIQW